ncbi:MAG: AMP phosphorylase [Nanoarchaeota archaeon]
MLLKVRDLNIHTGGPLIAIIYSKDADQMDIHYGDRILLKHNNHKAIAVADITHNKNTIRPGIIGLMEELENKLNAKTGAMVRISIIPKPESTRIIKKKMSGKRLSYKEFLMVIEEIVHNHLTESELAAFVTACFIHDLTNNEVVSLCKAMVVTGETLKFKRKPIMDVHCIGGVPGNRTTPIIVSIIAAAGLLIPKTSSRAITSPSGTADTVETMANVSLDIKKLKRVVMKTGGAMVWGGALNLAPADDKIIRVEHPLNIDAEGQMIASVMAKKFAVGSTHLLLDIPIGGTAKVRNVREATKLRKRFEYVSKSLGIKTRIIFTDGSEPIGNGIGPALEAWDIIKVIKNDKDAPRDLREKSLVMAGIMLEMVSKAKPGRGYELACGILDSGRALKKFTQILNAQGRSPRRMLKLGKHVRIYYASKSGKIAFIDARALSQIAKAAGAPKDTGAGVYIHHHLKESVKWGDPLITVYAQSTEKLHHASEVAKFPALFRIN